MTDNGTFIINGTEAGDREPASSLTGCVFSRRKTTIHIFLRRLSRIAVRGSSSSMTQEPAVRSDRTASANSRNGFSQGAGAHGKDRRRSHGHRLASGGRNQAGEFSPMPKCCGVFYTAHKASIKNGQLNFEPSEGLVGLHLAETVRRQIRRSNCARRWPCQKAHQARQSNRCVKRRSSR